MNDQATLNAIDYAVFARLHGAHHGARLRCRLAMRPAQAQATIFSARRSCRGTSSARRWSPATSAARRSSPTSASPIMYGMVVATTGWNAWIIYSIFLFVFLPYYVRTGPVHDAAVSRAAVQLDLPVSVRDFARDRLHLHAAGRVAVRGRAGDRADLRAADFRPIWRRTSNGESSFSP